ncbi:hypothetical protein S245_016241, partial [Arachis hypogaea]
MVNFTNPGILGDIANFRRYYEAPIISGREPNATTEEKKLGAERSAELSAKVNRVTGYLLIYVREQLIALSWSQTTLRFKLTLA